MQLVIGMSTIAWVATHEPQLWSLCRSKLCRIFKLLSPLYFVFVTRKNRQACITAVFATNYQTGRTADACRCRRTRARVAQCRRRAMFVSSCYVARRAQDCMLGMAQPRNGRSCRFIGMQCSSFLSVLQVTFSCFTCVLEGRTFRADRPWQSSGRARTLLGYG